MAQILLNLLINAADACAEAGPPRIDVRVSLCGSGPDAAVLCRIADNGPGVRPEDRERIFDPFYTTKAAGEGNGLGLMVCKGIVSDHRGQIEVTSTAQEGTEFRLLFPLSPGQEGSPEGEGI